jgi:molybdenum cofactor cytidylyltransferase
MGAANKLLLDRGDGPVVAKAAQNLVDSGIAEIICVTGCDAHRVNAALARFEVSVLFNAGWQDGLSTSIKSGVGAIPGDWAAVLICLGDMPAISPDTITQICTVAGDSNCAAVVPEYLGRNGHPVLWKREAFPLLLQSQADRGGRKQLELLGDRAMTLPVDDPGIHIDIDTPEAWQQYSGIIKS